MNISEKELRFQTVCLAIVAIVTVTFSLYFLRPIMIPFVLAVVANFILTAAIDAQQKYLKVPYPLAIFFSVLLGLASVILLWFLLSASFQQITSNAGIYEQRIRELLDKTVSFAQLDRFGVDAKSMVEPTLQKLSEGAGGIALTTINKVVGLFSKFFLVLIFVFFLIIGRKPASQKVSNGIWPEIEIKIKRYLVTKFFTSAATGAMVGFILLVLGVDLALFFGVAAFVLNFIPSIGSVIATLLPVPIILFTPGIAPWQIALAISLPAGIQFSIGNIIEPKIMGESLDLHPIVILMTLIFWGMIWGFVGMLLAAPLTAIMKIIFGRIDVTRPLADLMAGRMDSLIKD